MNRNATLSAPPNLQYEHGAVVFATFASTAIPGTYEVYCANTTGWEPVKRASDPLSAFPAADGAPVDSGGGRFKHPKLTTTVLRTTTTNFKTYTPYIDVLQFSTGGDPYPYSMPTVKSMARSEDDGKLESDSDSRCVGGTDSTAQHTFVPAQRVEEEGGEGGRVITSTASSAFSASQDDALSALR